MAPQRRSPFQLPYLHEQFLILDMRLWREQLGFQAIAVPYSTSIRFPAYISSDEKVNGEKYTPLWIEATSLPRLNLTLSQEFFGTGLIAASLELGIRVVNVPLALRLSKGFIYPMDPVPGFWNSSRSVVVRAPHGIVQLAASTLLPRELQTQWQRSYSTAELWPTVRTRASSPCFEISCGLTRPTASWVYVATNERPDVHSFMVDMIRKSRAVLPERGFVPSTGRGYVSVVGGFQGFTALVFAIAPTSITWIDFGQEQIFMGEFA